MSGKQVTVVEDETEQGGTVEAVASVRMKIGGKQVAVEGDKVVYPSDPPDYFTLNLSSKLRIGGKQVVLATQSETTDNHDKALETAPKMIVGD